MQTTDRHISEKTLNIIAIAISILVFLLVGMMRRYTFDIGVDLSFLPAVHAVLNTLATICLIYGFIQIKNKNITKHRNAMVTAIGFSVLFLCSYVIYHFTQEQTVYGGEGWTRNIYFVILITHIILAGAILPFILFTFIRAFVGSYERHKKLARWTFPIWLYVTITGPIVYLFMYPYY